MRKKINHINNDKYLWTLRGRRILLKYSLRVEIYYARAKRTVKVIHHERVGSGRRLLAIIFEMELLMELAKVKQTPLTYESVLLLGTHIHVNKRTYTHPTHTLTHTHIQILTHFRVEVHAMLLFHSGPPSLRRVIFPSTLNKPHEQFTSFRSLTFSLY